tara:strand:- start:116 stop:592 length:477 start_codon:yes stop_codon:yes gene_type:complete
VAKAKGSRSRSVKKSRSSENGFGLPASPAEMAARVPRGVPQESSEPEITVEQVSDTLGYITIKVPVILDESVADKMLPGYASRNIDFNGSNIDAASGKMLWCSLAEANERFKGGQSKHPDGRAVEALTHGVRWFLGKYAQGVEKLTGNNLLTDYNMRF